jgi:uncharacterized protein YlzI (FlbEa/FlbD family)
MKLIEFNKGDKHVYVNPNFIGYVEALQTGHTAIYFTNKDGYVKVTENVKDVLKKIENANKLRNL